MITDEQFRNLEKLVKGIDTRMNFLVGNEGQRGILLPNCEKKSIKKTLSLFKWVIFIYGTIILALVGMIVPIIKII